MKALLLAITSASLLALAAACGGGEPSDATPTQDELAQALAGQGRLVYGAEGLTQVVNADGTNAQTLPFHPGTVSARLDGATYIHVFPDGTAEVRLSKEDGSEAVLGPGRRPAVWSPDGTRLAVALEGEDGADLWTVDAATEAKTLVAEDVEVTFNGPAWSPDGRKLAYVAAASRELKVIDLASQESYTVTADLTGRIHALAWSPDGASIAYQRSTRGAEADIVVVDAGGGEPRKLGDGWWPGWSPDSSRIAYVGSTEPGLFVVDLAGAGRQVAPDANVGPTGRSQPAWSPDGKWVAYESVNGGILRLVNVKTGDIFDAVRKPASLLAWLP